MDGPRIRVLPTELANQIAAGEVVERPASVVKELVENSLDAGARRVVVQIEGGGRKLVRVVDDGGGMTPEEARLSLERHATSKLRAVDDLFRLDTMGFRGEALPSIAGVSRFTLTTRTAAQVAACRLSVEGGVIGGATDVGAPVGTQIEVRDLLFNVPARLKFLKADATEVGHIHDVVFHLALAHPDVHFRLEHGGRSLLDLPPHGSLLERVRVALGRRGDELAPWEHEESGVRVTVFVAPAHLAQGAGKGTQLFVGRRFVRDRGLSYAVKLGYGELLPSGKTPLALVFVDLEEGQVDINVHPQKTEVRFARPAEVGAAVRRAVAQGVARAPWLLGGAGAGHANQAARVAEPGAVAGVAPMAPMADLSERYAASQERFLFGWRPAADPHALSAADAHALPAWAEAVPAPRAPAQGTLLPGLALAVPERAAPRAEGQAGSAALAGATPAFDTGPGAPSFDAAQMVPSFDAVRAMSPFDPGHTAASFDPGHAAASFDAGHAAARDAGGGAARGRAPVVPGAPRLLGQVGPGLVLAEEPQGLLLVDPHLLDEARLLVASRRGTAASQRLLVPQALTLGAPAAQAADEHAAALAAVGFELEPFGGAAWALRAAPAGLEPDVAAELVAALLGELARGLPDGRAPDAFLAGRVACACALPTGSVLTTAQSVALLGAAAALADTPTSHPRPAVVRLSWEDLARRGGWG